MKVARFDRFGDPVEVLRIVEETLPEPGPNEVRVAVEASPIHIADLKFMRAELRFYKEPPGTPGMEGVGRVIGRGTAVESLDVGDRVLLPIRVGEHGGWRQQVNLTAQGLLRAPDDADPLQLSLVPINTPTAYLLLRGIRPVSAGDWVIQNAANSSCGRYLIALAKRWGIRTINVVRRDDLIDELQALGGDVVLLDGEDLHDRVAEATDNATVSLGIDAIAGAGTTRIARCLADEGWVLNYGMLSGRPCEIPPAELFLRGLTLHGFGTTRPMDKMAADEREAMYRELIDGVADGTLAAPIAATYTLDQIQDAVAHAARTGEDRRGKIIVTPNGPPEALSAD